MQTKITGYYENDRKECEIRFVKTSREFSLICLWVPFKLQSTMTYS